MEIQADLPTLDAVLTEMAAEFSRLYVAGLQEHDRIEHKADGKRLIDYAAQAVVNVDGTTYEVSVDLPHYWKYVEEGVQGDRNTGSPYRNPGWKAFPHILRWVERKPVIPRPFGGRLPSPKSLAYLITRSIVQHGTRGSHDFRTAQEAVIEKYRDRIGQALGHDALYYILKAQA